MDVLEYEHKHTATELIKNVIKNGNIEKILFCGSGIIAIISNSNIIKICVLSILVRKLYKIYKNNKEVFNNIIDNMV